ncbi:hypothetical protein ACHAWF_016013 [Thalassiosira exigua]
MGMGMGMGMGGFGAGFGGGLGAFGGGGGLGLGDDPSDGLDPSLFFSLFDDAAALFDAQPQQDVRKPDRLVCPTCMMVHEPVGGSERVAMPSDEAEVGEGEGGQGRQGPEAGGAGAGGNDADDRSSDDSIDNRDDDDAGSAGHTPIPGGGIRFRLGHRNNANVNANANDVFLDDSAGHTPVPGGGIRFRPSGAGTGSPFPRIEVRVAGTGGERGGTRGGADADPAAARGEQDSSDEGSLDSLPPLVSTGIGRRSSGFRGDAAREEAEGGHEDSFGVSGLTAPSPEDGHGSNDVSFGASMLTAPPPAGLDSSHLSAPPPPAPRDRTRPPPPVDSPVDRDEDRHGLRRRSVREALARMLDEEDEDADSIEGGVEDSERIRRREVRRALERMANRDSSFEEEGRGEDEEEGGGEETSGEGVSDASDEAVRRRRVREELARMAEGTEDEGSVEVSSLGEAEAEDDSDMPSLESVDRGAGAAGGSRGDSNDNDTPHVPYDPSFVEATVRAEEQLRAAVQLAASGMTSEQRLLYADLFVGAQETLDELEDMDREMEDNDDEDDGSSAESSMPSLEDVPERAEGRAAREAAEEEVAEVEREAEEGAPSEGSPAPPLEDVPEPGGEAGQEEGAAQAEEVDGDESSTPSLEDRPEGPGSSPPGRPRRTLLDVLAALRRDAERGVRAEAEDDASSAGSSMPHLESVRAVDSLQMDGDDSSVPSLEDRPGGLEGLRDDPLDPPAGRRRQRRNRLEDRPERPGDDPPGRQRTLRDVLAEFQRAEGREEGDRSSSSSSMPPLEDPSAEPPEDLVRPRRDPLEGAVARGDVREGGGGDLAGTLPRPDGGLASSSSSLSSSLMPPLARGGDDSSSSSSSSMPALIGREDGSTSSSSAPANLPIPANIPSLIGPGDQSSSSSAHSIPPLVRRDTSASSSSDDPNEAAGPGPRIRRGNGGVLTFEEAAERARQNRARVEREPQRSMADARSGLGEARRSAASASSAAAPSNPLTHLRDYGALRVYARATCPVCLEEVEPIVALKCGHALCEDDYRRMGGYLASDRERLMRTGGGQGTSRARERGRTTSGARAAGLTASDDGGRRSSAPSVPESASMAALERIRSRIEGMSASATNELSGRTDLAPTRRDVGRDGERGGTSVSQFANAAEGNPASRTSRGRTRSDAYVWGVTRRDCGRGCHLRGIPHHVLYSVYQNGTRHEGCYVLGSKAIPDGTGGLWIHVNGEGVSDPGPAERLVLHRSRRGRESQRYSIPVGAELVSDGHGGVWAAMRLNGPSSTNGPLAVWRYTPDSTRDVATIPSGSQMYYAGRGGQVWVWAGNDDGSHRNMLCNGLWLLGSRPPERKAEAPSREGGVCPDGLGGLWYFRGNGGALQLYHLDADDGERATGIEFSAALQVHGCHSSNAAFVLSDGLSENGGNCILQYVHWDPEGWQERVVGVGPLSGRSKFASDRNGGLWALMAHNGRPNRMLYRCDSTAISPVHEWNLDLLPAELVG